MQWGVSHYIMCHVKYAVRCVTLHHDVTYAVKWALSVRKDWNITLCPKIYCLPNTCTLSAVYIYFFFAKYINIVCWIRDYTYSWVVMISPDYILLEISPVAKRMHTTSVQLTWFNKWKVPSGPKRPLVTTTNHCRFPGSALKEVFCHCFPPDLPRVHSLDALHWHAWKAQIVNWFAN